MMKMIAHLITILVMLCSIRISGGQSCIDRVKIQQDGDRQLSRNRIGIVPFLNFTCNGTISRIMARVFRNNETDRNDYPYFQVWRPSSNNSLIYTNIGEVQLQESQVSQCNSNRYCNVNIVLTGNDTIEFLSGDVVGYYHPSLPRYRIATINISGYVQYRFILSSMPSSVNLNHANGSDLLLPLIQFVIGGSGSSGGSSSAGAAVGGTIGALLFVILFVVLVLVIGFYVRQLQRKKEFSVKKGATNVASNKATKNDVTAVVNPVPMYDSINLDRKPKPVETSHSHEYQYVEGDSDSSTIKPVKMPLPYEIPLLEVLERSLNKYEIPTASPYELAQSMEQEKSIYETVTFDNKDYGPAYQKPPFEEKKIYEEFEGKIFRKLLRKEVKTLEQLGTGAFGVVNRGMWKPSYIKEVEVAIKTLSTNSTDKNRVRFLQEAAIMCQFDHENVIKLYGVVTDAPTMIVLEYMSCGDLRNLLVTLQPNDEDATHVKLPILLLKFCKEIAAGMEYLNGKKFIHRDLAARNVLLSNDLTCKVADFGMSRDLLNDNYYITSGGKIPVKWTAPE
ncbi:ephrin type-A receptor 4-like isoform X2 [Dysidea avara]